MYLVIWLSDKILITVNIYISLINECLLSRNISNPQIFHIFKEGTDTNLYGRIYLWGQPWVDGIRQKTLPEFVFRIAVRKEHSIIGSFLRNDPISSSVFRIWDTLYKISGKKCRVKYNNDIIWSMQNKLSLFKSREEGYTSVQANVMKYTYKF